jgi:Holliday junction resolvase RusA-like endonuclease
MGGILARFSMGVNSYVYEIDGNPIPLQRHRNFGKRCYDPQKKQKADMVKFLDFYIKPLVGPSVALKLHVEYHMPIPKSYTKRSASEALWSPHTKKPDLTNLMKFTEDVFNGILWEDDSFISEIYGRKFYSNHPKTVFHIEIIEIEEFKKTCIEKFLQTANEMGYEG